MERIIIYGAGGIGRGLCKIVEREGRCKVECFLDRDINLHNTYIDNKYLVKDPESIFVDKKVLTVVTTVACSFTEIKMKLMGEGYQEIVTVGRFVRGLFANDNIIFANMWQLKTNIAKEIYTKIFCDRESELNWIMACGWFVAEREDNYFVKDKKRYFPVFLDHVINNCNVMFDTAALNGEYVDTFLEKKNNGIVYAMVLNPPSLDYEMLEEKYALNKNVHLLNYEAGEETGCFTDKRFGLMEPFTILTKNKRYLRRIDDIENLSFDYLRCYSMGKVEPILKGAKAAIIKNRPVLAVNIGHYDTDFINVPILLDCICKDYNFYFRVHNYQGSDCILYAVPREKEFVD